MREPTTTRSRRQNGVLFPLWGRSYACAPASAIRAGSLVASAILISQPALAQEALRNSMAGDAAAEAARIQPESMPYTVKSGDFRLLATPGLTFDWNDNINLSKNDPLSDFILLPTLGLKASYPVTQRNLLQFDVTFGYQEYLEHSQYSTWYVQSGSALSFDIYVKDFLINLHDRFSYVQNSSQQAAVANTGMYGTGDNSAGFNVTWDLEDVVLNLGYDHVNNFSTSQQFSYTDYASEMVVARGGFKFHPTVTAGVELTTAYTAYDQTTLNDNMNYSAGLYADWQPGHVLHVKPRFGYTYFQFQQTSGIVNAVNQGAWYLDLTVNHDITEAITYGLSAGHELTLGIYGNTIEDWYVRPNVTFKIIKDLTLNTFFSYQNGTQGILNLTGSLAEDYNWFTWGITLSHPIVKRLTAALNYQLTLRTSNYPSREYNQNLIGIQLTYNVP
jgi:hypothetical protein